jgi:hypothetical protein
MMSVYVDKAQNPYGRMKMCHMLADTLDELHAMADAIGVQRRWFQDDKDHPHYDIAQSKRALAIQHGSIEIDNRQLVELIRKWRAERKEQNCALNYKYTPGIGHYKDCPVCVGECVCP